MNIITVLFSLLTLIAHILHAQCSDAGICALKDQKHGEVKRYTLGVSYIFGKSSNVENINYHSARIDGSVFFPDNVVLTFLIPYNAQQGPLGTVAGIGDAIVSMQYNFLQTKDISLSVQAGIKISTGNENKDSSLPQMYQSGLGSNDLLLGITGAFGIYNVLFGYQKAGERNINSLTRLKRGDDLLVKVGTTIPLEPFTFNISYLLIQRLSDSSVKDSSRFGSFVNIPNSGQTQLNLMSDIEVQISTALTIRSGFAIPFLKRKVNADGLTRTVTLSFGLQSTF